MEYVLHIGMPKTGSLSLQRAFFENRSVLRRLGVVYPVAGIKPGTNAKAKHNKLKHALVGCDPKEIGMPEDWMEKFRAETEGAEICVVSDQHFHRLLKPELVLPLFPRNQTRVVIYLREPVIHVASQYAHSVKIIHNRTMSLQEYAKFICWSNVEIVDRWIKTFGRENVMMRKYDRHSLLDEDIVKDFAHLVRPGLEKIFSIQKYVANRSFAGNLLFIKRVLNHFIEAKYNGPICREMSELARFNPRFQGRFFVDQETVNLIASLFREDFEVMGKRFGFFIKPRDEIIDGSSSPEMGNLLHDYHLIRSKVKEGGNLAALLDELVSFFKC